MLAYILAIAVGLASLSLYLSAFFLPELHRKDDFLWSGVGLFYALVLWVCAGRITGGVLLGQSASVTLVLCFGWQTLRLRRAIAHPDETPDITGFSFLVWLQNRFQKPSASPVVETPEETETTSESQTSAETETTDDDTEVISESQTSAETETTDDDTEIISEVEQEEETKEASLTSEDTETPETKKQGFSLKSIFGRGKSQSPPTSEVPEADLEESNWDDDDEEVSEMIEQTEAIASVCSIISETSSSSSSQLLSSRSASGTSEVGGD